MLQSSKSEPLASERSGAQYSFDITQEPGKALNFQFSFAADWENRIEVADRHGNILADVNGNNRPYSELNIPQNQTNTSTYFRVRGFFKYKRDGNVPWASTLGMRTDPAPGKIRIGFQDQPYPEFNNAVVIITVT